MGSKIVELQAELRETKEEIDRVNVELDKLRSKKRNLEERSQSIKAELKSLVKSQQGIEKFEDGEFPWSKKIYEILKSVFKIDDFRLLQKAAINATLSKIDCLVILPTGSGKSLVFQLPAVLSNGVTLVVSPLISLMADQLQSLKALNIETYVLNSQTDKDESKLIFNSMIDVKSKLRILYVTPEKLAKSKRFMSQLEKMYRAGRFERLVIDEVHCCSEYGHDFRPDYKFLGIMKNQFPNTSILGLTASATQKVIVDCQKMLNIEGSLVFKGCFYRSNLKYEIYDAISSNNQERIQEIGDLIKSRFSGQSGIIYCLTIKDTEDVAKGLKSMGFKVNRYHAQMEPEYRAIVQSEWYSNNLQIIVATVAFGMGINKLDVRFVIHFTLSKSIENYYQETGRAGRDGKKAYCIAFYRFGDIFRATSLTFTERSGQVNVYKMLSYCLNRKACRKEQIAEYFGDKLTGIECNTMCDNCGSQEDQEPFREIEVSRYYSDLIEIFTLAMDNNQRLTPLKLIDSWLGKGDKKNRSDKVQIPKLPRDTCEQIVANLLINHYLKEEFHFTPYSTISYIVPGVKELKEGQKLRYQIKSSKVRQQQTNSKNNATKNGKRKQDQETAAAETPSNLKKAKNISTTSKKNTTIDKNTPNPNTPSSATKTPTKNSTIKSGNSSSGSSSSSTSSKNENGPSYKKFSFNRKDLKVSSPPSDDDIVEIEPPPKKSSPVPLAVIELE